MLSAGTVWPWNSVSFVVQRQKWYDGCSYRSTSSNACGISAGSSHQLAALVGMIAEQAARPGDRGRGRVAAGRGDQREIRDDLVASQRSRRAVLVLELELHQLGHDVVGRVLLAPVEVLVEPRGRVEDALQHFRLGVRRRLVRVRLEDREQSAWSSVGTPTSMPMTCTGSFSAKSCMKSKWSRPTRSSTISVAECADLRLQAGHCSRREQPGDDAAMHRVAAAGPPR